MTTEPLAALQLVEQAPRQHDRGEEIHLKNVMPVVARRSRSSRAACRPRALGEIAALLTSACSSPSQPALGLGDRRVGVLGIGQIDLDVILRSRLPRAVFRERMPRAGDDAPAGGGKSLHRGVADAAAGSGEQQRAARLVGVGHGPFCSSLRSEAARVTDKAASWSTARPSPRAGRRSGHAAGRPLLPELDLHAARRGSPTRSGGRGTVPMPNLAV